MRREHAERKEQCHPRRRHRHGTDAAPLYGRLWAGSGNHTFFLGALYLFFINAFFIALSSFLVFKVLKVPPHGNIAEAHFRKQRLVLVTLGLLITIPSIYLAHQTVKDALQEVQVKSFIQTDMQFEKTSVVSYALKDDTLTVDLVGAVLTEEQIEQLKTA